MSSIYKGLNEAFDFKAMQDEGKRKVAAINANPEAYSKKYGIPLDQKNFVGSILVAMDREEQRARQQKRDIDSKARQEEFKAKQLAQDKENISQLKAELAQLEKQFDPSYEYSDDYTFWNKQKGIASQISALKKRISDVDSQQVNELSPQTLASYKKKAGADASAADKKGDYKRGDKRMSGIIKATKKEFDNDSKNVSEDELDEACWKGYHKEGNKKMFGKTYPNCVKNTNEEQLDEKCWDTHKQVGMKNKGGKSVPNCVPKESVAEGWVDTIKNIFKRKPRDNRTVFDRDPEAMREFERSGGYEAGLDIMGWQIGWFAAEHAQGDTMQQAFSKLYYGGGSPMPFDNRSFKLAWVAYNKHHGPQIAEQGVAEDQHSCPHCGGEMVSEELMNEKKDACYYKVKSRYKVWPSAYASGALVKCRKKGADSWGNGGKKNESSILEGIEQVDENLHKWFKEKWVRFGPDGKIRGDCARGDDSEGKPKCLPQSKAQNLGKKGRASAAARKRREDPNPERSGKAINVNTKKKANEEALDEKWSQKYKDSINCSNPKGFSQKAHCQGKNK